MKKENTSANNLHGENIVQSIACPNDSYQIAWENRYGFCEGFRSDWPSLRQNIQNEVEIDVTNDLSSDNEGLIVTFQNVFPGEHNLIAI